MDVELTIEWDGDAPGITEHRLSIGAFGEALTALLSALRRTASSMAKLAEGDSELGSRGGRLSSEATRVDLEIVALRGNSLAADMACIVRPAAGAQQAMVYDLAGRAAERLVEDIESESRGQHRNYDARAYLAKLPGGLRRQRYQLRRDGIVVKDVTLGETKLAEPIAMVPPMRHLVGTVVALGFGSDGFVQLKTSYGTTGRLAASPEQVEQALLLRNVEVQCLALIGKMGRVLWLCPADAPAPAVPVEKRTERMLRDWSDLLHALAQ